MSRPSLCANFLTFFEQYAVPYDICYTILRRCDWIDLLTASSCDRRFRMLACRILRRRIRSILLHFLPEERIPHFWTFMKSCNSCIFGGVVACAMMGELCLSFHSVAAPSQLDIVVPKSVSSPSPSVRFERFLRTMNYELLVADAKNEAGPYAACTHRIDIFYHSVIISFYHPRSH